MSVKKLAAATAAKGRGGDSMLVHMNPAEFQGLSGLGALVGRQVTRNPQTGLPEMFSLNDLMGYALPIAASFIGGPLAGAAVGGAMNYAKTGNAESALLGAGLGYGAGSLLGGLSNTAGGEVVQNSTQAGAQAGTQAGAQAGTQATADQLAQQGTASLMNETPTLTTPATSLGDKWSALRNTDWTAKGGPLIGSDGKPTPMAMLTAGSAMGLAGLQDQAAYQNAWQKQQQAQADHARRVFNYYQGYAGSGVPANTIAPYSGS